jgi:hypothetical protein
MPDSFFERKRKRPAAAAAASGSGGKGGASSSRAASRPQRKAAATKPARDAGGDESDEGEGAVEGMDLRHEYEHSVRSEDEDEQETPAEARVRLARMYVEGMRGDDVGEWPRGPHAQRAPSSTCGGRSTDALLQTQTTLMLLRPTRPTLPLASPSRPRRTAHTCICVLPRACSALRRPAFSPRAATRSPSHAP